MNLIIFLLFVGLFIIMYNQNHEKFEQETTPTNQTQTTPTTPEKKNKFKSILWFMMDNDKRFKQSSLYKNIVCGVNKDNFVYCKDGKLEEATWMPIGVEKIKQILVYKEGVYAIDMKNNLYYKKNYKDYDDKWEKVTTPDKIKKIGSDGETLGVITMDNKVFYKKGDKEWTQIVLDNVTDFLDIAISNGKIMLTTQYVDKPITYYIDNYPNYTSIPMSFNKISFDNNLICGVTGRGKHLEQENRNKMYCIDTNLNNMTNESDWTPVEGKWVDVSVHDNNVLGINTIDDLYMQIHV